MKNTLKNSKIKIGVAIIVAAILTTIVAPVYTTYAAGDGYSYVPPAGTIRSVQDLLGAEARAQLTAYVAIHCLMGGVNRNEPWSNVIKNNKWFDRAGNDMTINTGYWYEKQVQGKFDDGRIKCSDTGGKGPLEVLAAQLNYSDRDMYCAENASGVAWNKDGYNCGSNDGKYTRHGNGGSDIDDYDGAHVIDSWSTAGTQPFYKHLKKLYDAKKDEKKWENGFDTVNNYKSGMVGYFLYRTEIETKCGGAAETYDTKPSDMDMVLIDVTQDSTQAGKTIYTRYSTNASFTHEFVDNSYVGSCKTMIARANAEEIYGNYRDDRMVPTLNYLCKEDIDRRKEIVENDPNMELSPETLQAYSDAVNNTTNFSIGQFIEGDETTGWSCIDVGDFEGAHQEDPTPDDYGASEPSCYDNAGSLGWILCPIINQAADAIQGIYESMVVPFLVLEPGLFDPSNGAYGAWTQFRDIANIAFIVMFLIVIFSQLTGFGIDNYGVKKILPKLIIAAVLINLSYIICQAAVDIANVTGYAVRGLFESIAANNFDPNSVSLAETGGSTLQNAGTATAIIIVLILLLTAGVFLTIGPSALIPVFMTVISVFIGIFFIFVVLSVRKAFAVILVVISPLAFVCYMLPNTKKLFDKWFSAFQAMLIAFPVCSAMMYGGQAVARILISAAGGASIPSVIAISAAVISIVPLFLIPNVIKMSMGAISGGIMRFGNGLQMRGKHAFGRSGLAQTLDRKGIEHRAGIKFDKNGNAKYNMRGRLQNKFTRSAAGKQRLDTQRRMIAQQHAQEAGSGQFIGEAGLRRIDNMNAAAAAGRASQDVQDEITAMGSDYKTDDDRINAFYELAAQDTLSDQEQLRYKALMTSLSSSSQGKKALATVARGEKFTFRATKDNAAKGIVAGATVAGQSVSTDSMRQMADYATTGDGGVLSAIDSKDAFAADYVKAVATNPSAGDFGTYMSATGTDGRTNEHRVTEDILDDNTRLMSQSGAARTQAISTTRTDGSHVVSDARLTAIHDDKDLQAQYGDKIADMFTKNNGADGKRDLVRESGLYAKPGADPIRVTQKNGRYFMKDPHGRDVDITKRMGEFRKVGE